MAGRPIKAEKKPTSGPWLVRGEAEPGASAAETMLGVEPATPDRPSGWPYLIRQDRPIERGNCPLHLATGIQRLADAKLMAAAPELAETLFRLLTSPDLLRSRLDQRTRVVIIMAWDLLVKADPHLEI